MSVGRTLEQWFHGALESVPEGGKRELEVSLEGRGKPGGSGCLRLAVEHQEGQVLVTVQGGAAPGVGGLMGTATFRFGSDQEAADAMAALAQAGPETGMARAFHAAGRLQSVDLVGKITDDVKLDLAKGELVIGTSIDAGFNQSVPKKMLSGVLKESNQRCDARGSVSLEQRFPLSLRDIEQIQRRGLPALREIAMDGTRRSRTEAVFQLEGRLGGLDFRAVYRGTPAELLEAIKNVDVLSRKDWSFQGFKVSGPVSTDFDAGAVKVKATVKDRRTVIAGKGELAPLVKQGTSRMEEDRAAAPRLAGREERSALSAARRPVLR